jgi:ornithine cyclodeaminase/alanine dehydrogenase-like protein (mu-crystallin family)
VLDDPQELVKKSEIVIAATTSDLPVFSAAGQDISGKTFISIRFFRPDMQEFSNEMTIYTVFGTFFWESL